jgi:hypothetical protein
MLFMTIFSLTESKIQKTESRATQIFIDNYRTTDRGFHFCNTHKKVYHKSLMTDTTHICFQSLISVSLPLSSSSLFTSSFSLFTSSFPSSHSISPLSPTPLRFYFPLFTSPSPSFHFHFSPLHFSFTFSFLLFPPHFLPPFASTFFTSLSPS